MSFTEQHRSPAGASPLGRPRPRHRPRAARVLLVCGCALAAGTLAAGSLAGCGASGPAAPARALALGRPPRLQTTAGGAPPSTSTASTTATHATGTASRADPRPPASGTVVARMDASSDRIIAEGKLHIAEGAPSNAEIRREIEIARKAGIRLPSGDSASSFENAGPETAGGVEIETPETVWNPRGKPIADWIVPVLEWAYQHGWRGTVTSGYRTYYEQAQLNAAGAFSAPAGLSNHETTKYPGGAVDVTEPSQLIAVLRGYTGPMKLIGGVLGPVDPEHFSATGD